MPRPPAEPRRARRAHSAAELRDAAVAVLALARAQLRVWTRPPGRLVTLRPPAPDAPDASASAEVPRLERAVRDASVALERAVRRGRLRPSCLVRSLALADLLERRGVPGGLIRIGVRRDAGTLDAHAWVELDGRVVGDDPRRVRRFTPLGAVVAAPRR